MATATGRTAHERATLVQEAIEAAFEPGGDLHQALDDLVGRAHALAVVELGAEVRDNDPVDLGRNLIRNQAGWSIADLYFKSAFSYAQGFPDEA